MTDPKLRGEIDDLWLAFHVGGVTNPLTVIEQITYLMFCRRLDEAEARREKRDRQLRKPHRSVFPEDTPEVRWTHFRQIADAGELLATVRDRVFPFLRTLGDRGLGGAGKFLADAALVVASPALVFKAVGAVGRLPLDGDDKGDLYEYLLSKLSTAGINGQFRTPRHVIRLMVDLVAPRPDETVCDPACGTAGFLVGVLEHLHRHPAHTSPEGAALGLAGDRLEPHREHIDRHMLYGFDFDVTMLRIGAMNLMLHGQPAPNLAYQNTLSPGFADSKAHGHLSREAFDLVLANPPFAGNVDAADLDPVLTRAARTRKTELLYLALVLKLLKPAGRAGVIVPAGVLFGGTGAHKQVRQALLDDHQLDAVVALPGGVFKPYAGVATAILLFTKGGRTERVWFYDVASDGRSLDDKRTELDDHDGDFADVRARWAEREANPPEGRAGQCFVVGRVEIAAAGYDLSVGRYRQPVAAAVEHEPPAAILGRLEKLGRQHLADLANLKSLLGVGQ